jgi:Mrp family chromosome partitioning ATPase/capsular polysaccharide biosynthesis protein
MMDRGPIADHRSAFAWPATEPGDVVEDGPLALLTAVFAAFRRHLLKIIAWTAFCVVLAIAYVRATPPTYIASTTLLLEPRRPVSAREAQSPPGFDLNRADSELQVIRSERLLADVFDGLGLSEHPELRPGPPGLVSRIIGGLRGAITDPIGTVRSIGGWERTAAPAPDRASDARDQAFAAFARRISARRIGQSYAVEISYSTSDAELAPRVANAAASAYLAQSIAFKADMARSGTEFVQGRLDSLSEQARSAAAAVTQGALPSVPTPDADARVIGAARKPLSPTAPRPTLLILLGGAIGFTSALVAAALASMLDRRIRTADDIRRQPGLPLLGTIDVPKPAKQPIWHLDELRSLGELKPSGAQAAAIANIRAAVKLSCPGRAGTDNHIIAIVGCSPGVGATAISLAMARFNRALGKRVTVIQTDVHREPRLLAGPSPRVGSSLVEAITGNTPVEAVPYVDLSGILFMPARSAGIASTRPIDLADRRMARLLDAATARGDVIIDLPPLSESPGSSAVARLADAVAVVVSSGRTTTDELRETMRILRSAGAVISGVVLARSVPAA